MTGISHLSFFLPPCYRILTNFATKSLVFVLHSVVKLLSLTQVFFTKYIFCLISKLISVISHLITQSPVTQPSWELVHRTIMKIMDISLFILLFKILEYCCFQSRSFPILESLDRFLCRVLSEPCKWSGNETVEAMTVYNWSLTSLRECVERRERVVAKAARDLRVQGGPLFLKQKMSRSAIELLKIDFGWTEHEMQHLMLLRSDILKNWRLFYKVYRKNQSFYNSMLNDTNFWHDIKQGVK